MIRQLPNFITSINLVIGCIGIYFVINHQDTEALYFVIAAAIMDVADGLLARWLKAKSEIGAQLDSLADMVSFGILPAFYMLMSLKEVASFYWAALLIAVFSAWRLAKFNVDDRQEHSFMGLPTPANALMITSLCWVDFEKSAVLLLGVTFCSCVLLVAPIPLLSLKFEAGNKEANRPRWMLMIGSFLIVAILGWRGVPWLIPFYLVLSILYRIIMSRLPTK